jgi:glucose uptake protein GlcU
LFAFALLTVLPIGLTHILISIYFCMHRSLAVINSIKNAKLLVMLLLIISSTLILLSVLIEIFSDIHTNIVLVGGAGMILGHLINYSNHKHAQMRENYP